MASPLWSSLVRHLTGTSCSMLSEPNTSAAPPSPAPCTSVLTRLYLRPDGTPPPPGLSLTTYTERGVSTADYPTRVARRAARDASLCSNPRDRPGELVTRPSSGSGLGVPSPRVTSPEGQNDTLPVPAPRSTLLWGAASQARTALGHPVFSVSPVSLTLRLDEQCGA